MRALGLLLALALPLAARADEPPPEAWELDAFAGYGRLLWPTMDTTGQTSSSGGPGFSLTVAYRGPHFTHPFLDIAYVPILSSSRDVTLPGTGGPGTTSSASNLSWAWGFLVGPGWDVRWFRLRAGVGVYDVMARTTVADQTNTGSQLSVGFLAAASALVWRSEPFAVGIEARLVALQSPTSGIYQTSWQIGVTGRWDFVYRP
jgi:hypothetical protein